MTEAETTKPPEPIAAPEVSAEPAPVAVPEPQKQSAEKSPIDRYLSAAKDNIAATEAAKKAKLEAADKARFDELSTRFQTMFGWDLASAFKLSLHSPTQIKMAADGYRPIIVTMASMFVILVGQQPFRDDPVKAMASALAAAKL